MKILYFMSSCLDCYFGVSTHANLIECRHTQFCSRGLVLPIKPSDEFVPICKFNVVNLMCLLPRAIVLRCHLDKTINTDTSGTKMIVDCKVVITMNLCVICQVHICYDHNYNILLKLMLSSKCWTWTNWHKIATGQHLSFVYSSNNRHDICAKIIHNYTKLFANYKSWSLIVMKCGALHRRCKLRMKFLLLSSVFCVLPTPRLVEPNKKRS